MASGFETSNISDFLAFLSESVHDSDSAADSEIILDAGRDVLHLSESDSYDDFTVLSNSNCVDNNEPSPSTRCMCEDQAKTASREVEVSDGETEESARDNGSSDRDTNGDGECPPPMRAKCAKRKCKPPKQVDC